MADVNTVVIVSDKQELINQIVQKLVLLRNFDKVKSCTIEEAQTTLDELNSNVVILHCENNNQRAIGLVKKLRQQDEYKNLPILLLNENCSRETVIEAFDCGVSDVLFMPIIDYELLIRVIWCLQKNELNANIESKTAFLSRIGIIQAENGIYSEKYCDEFLKNEIAYSKKQSQKACILLITPDERYLEDKTIKDFVKTLRKSIRLADSIAAKDEEKFYIFLPKTKLNGAYSVYERINENLGDFGASASVVEVIEQDFDEIKEALDLAIEKAAQNTKTLIVASEFFAKEEENLIPQESAIDVKKGNSIPEEIEEVDIDSELDFLISQELEPRNIMFKEPSNKKPQSAYDRNSIKLFNQAYVRKLKVVVNPVFKKYENFLKTKRQDFDIDCFVGTKSEFSVNLRGVCASITIEYDGVERAFVQLMITQDNQKKLYETSQVDFTVLDYQRMSSMMNQLISKFFAVLKKRG